MPWYSSILRLVVPWWQSPVHVPDAARSLLHNYSGIAEDQIEQHVTTFREKAWSINPYPCVGMCMFLRPTLHFAKVDNEYEQILNRVKGGERVLDVGCAMAQDLRTLAADGAPTENMFGTDITQEFWEASFDLFCDRSRMQATFIKSDIFDDHSPLVRDYENSFDILICGDFFHLFNFESQVQAAIRCVRLSRARPGTTIIGKQIGALPPMTISTGFSSKAHMYLHDESSFRKMWTEVEEQTQTRWDVRVRTVAFGEESFWSPSQAFAWMGEARCGIEFVIVRL